MLKHSEKYKYLIKYMAAFILVAVPLYPKFPSVNIPGTFVAIRLEDFLIVFAALLLFPLLLQDVRNLIGSELARSIGLYLLIGLVSLLSGIYVLRTVSPLIGALHWLRRVEYMMPLFLGFYAVRLNKNSFQYYLKLIIMVLVVVFLYGYGQKNYSFPIIITQNAEYSAGVALRYIPGAHINSTFAGHYDLATYLVLILPVIVVLFSTFRSYLKKIVFFLIWLAGLWLLVNSASRISLVSYMAASTFSLVLVKKYRYIAVMVVVSILFINFSSNLIARYTRLFEVAVKRITYNIDEEIAVSAQSGNLPERKDRPQPTPTPLPRFEDRSTNIRLDVEWPRAIRALKKNPILGTGFSSITLATDNDYLRLLGETGIFGFLAFLLVGLRLIKIFLVNYPFKKAKDIERYFLFGIIGGIAGILVNAVFIDVFEASKFAISFWLLMGMSIALIQNENSEYL